MAPNLALLSNPKKRRKRRKTRSVSRRRTRRRTRRNPAGYATAMLGGNPRRMDILGMLTDYVLPGSMGLVLGKMMYNYTNLRGNTLLLARIAAGALLPTFAGGILGGRNAILTGAGIALTGIYPYVQQWFSGMGLTGGTTTLGDVTRGRAMFGGKNKYPALSASPMGPYNESFEVISDVTSAASLGAFGEGLNASGRYN